MSPWCQRHPVHCLTFHGVRQVPTFTTFATQHLPKSCGIRIQLSLAPFETMMVQIEHLETSHVCLRSPLPVAQLHPTTRPSVTWSLTMQRPGKVWATIAAVEPKKGAVQWGFVSPGSIHFEYISLGRVCHSNVQLLQRTACGQICPSTTCMRQHGLSVMGPRPGGELARRLQARAS